MKCFFDQRKFIHTKRPASFAYISAQIHPYFSITSKFKSEVNEVAIRQIGYLKSPVYVLYTTDILLQKGMKIFELKSII